VEAQTDIQTYLDQGKQALAQGKARDAAIAYAHGAQIEPDNPMVHLGLAEANLALGNYGVVQMACHRVQELQPRGGLEETTAQALLDLLDRRYERALQHADAIISEDPSIAYAHALRAHLLRALGNDYDASLARARAARLSFGGRFENCFPAIDPSYLSGYKSQPSAPTPPPPPVTSTPEPPSSRTEREQVPTWSQPGLMRRQIVRTRFMVSRYPNLVTNILIAINVIIYLIAQVFPALYTYGIQANELVQQGEYWRIFTAMFLHLPFTLSQPLSILHLVLNMVSLSYIGRGVEIFYGKWRYLLIYLLSGIFGGLTYYFIGGINAQPALGASGAIFGVFGALGVFFITNRRALGPMGASVIQQWVIFLLINLAFSLLPGIGLWDHLGGLVAGAILSFLLIPRERRSRTR